MGSQHTELCGAYGCFRQLGHSGECRIGKLAMLPLSDLEKLRAEVERLTEEREKLKAIAAQTEKVATLAIEAVVKKARRTERQTVERCIEAINEAFDRDEDVSPQDVLRSLLPATPGESEPAPGIGECRPHSWEHCGTICRLCGVRKGAVGATEPCRSKP